jgi:hypothetical protein
LIGLPSVDNALHFLIYLYHDKSNKEKRIIRQRLPSRDIIVLTPYTIKGDWIMYTLTIGSIVYLFDNDKDARKAFHQAVSKNGINNVKVTYND